MSRRRAGWMISALVMVLALAGCAGTAAPPPAPPAPAPAGPALPARPAALPLDRLDPCGLLTPAQRGLLGLDAGTRGENTDEFGSPDCLWPPSSLPPYGGPLARLIVKRGAEYYLGSTQAVQVVDIGGFAAVQTTSAYLDPREHCLVLVDVAAGQTLWTQYGNLHDDHSGITNQLACAKAREGAQAMVQTLRAHEKK